MSVKARIEAQLIAGGRGSAARTAFAGAMRASEQADLRRAVEGAVPLPDTVGEAIVRVAPARGPVEVYEPREMGITESGAIRERRAGWLGQAAVRRADAFDVMQAQAARRWRGSGVAPALFTPAQLSAGRAYAALAERHASAGMRCASLEATHRGDGSGSFVDALLADARRLGAMREAIGSGWALEPCEAAPHRDRRRAIAVRTLVDAVCIEDRTLSDVLSRFGWSRNGKTRDRLRTALCAALDRVFDAG